LLPGGLDGAQVVHNEAMANALFDFYNTVLGENFEPSGRIDLTTIGYPTEDLSALDVCFSEAEV